MLISLQLAAQTTFNSTTLPYPAQYVPRIETGAVLEPKNQIWHGVGQEWNKTGNNQKCIEKYYDTLPAGTKPSIFMVYQGLKSYAKNTKGAEFFKAKMERYGKLNPNMIPQLGLSMTFDGNPELCYVDTVAAGGYDDAIENFAQAVKAYNKPIFIRLGYEFNGEWNGYKPASFVKAYNRVAKRIKEVCKGQEVALVWCFASDGKVDDFMPFYPGDKYVDWWGIDLFGTDHFELPETHAFLKASMAKKKPVMIGESTPRRLQSKDGLRTWYAWFAPMMRLIYGYPSIKAFCYINWDWSETPWADWGDGRIQHSPELYQKWVQELQKPHWKNLK